MQKIKINITLSVNAMSIRESIEKIIIIIILLFCRIYIKL